jgi:methionine-S-sulfoxide reductase
MKTLLLFFTLSILTAGQAMADVQKAYFGGGCFWCMEAGFQDAPNVANAISGYADDGVEIVEVHYDPQKISYEQLLEIYWRNVDPFDSGGQFFDRGHKYRTAIYVANDAERAAAEASKAKMSAEFGKPVAVQILPVNGFKRAEEGHQDYFKTNAEHYKRYKKGSGREDFLKRMWGDKP